MLRPCTLLSTLQGLQCWTILWSNMVQVKKVDCWSDYPSESLRRGPLMMLELAAMYEQTQHTLPLPPRPHYCPQGLERTLAHSFAQRNAPVARALRENLYRKLNQATKLMLLAEDEFLDFIEKERFTALVPAISELFTKAARSERGWVASHDDLATALKPLLETQSVAMHSTENILRALKAVRHSNLFDKADKKAAALDFIGALAWIDEHRQSGGYLRKLANEVTSSGPIPSLGEETRHRYLLIVHYFLVALGLDEEDPITSERISRLVLAALHMVDPAEMLPTNDPVMLLAKKLGIAPPADDADSREKFLRTSYKELGLAEDAIEAQLKWMRVNSPENPLAPAPDLDTA